ncbi:hypothetical protein Dacet_2210 [Denitrovibrio acetiphilus DSM 12809]|jgi:hypothetical protein|uniref:Uncharacterized protein n=1 Tax=Denitrovibrio acetiphilus (strain DSM 12809 / NBRC 114555 / N2460) TaxID=522772 RepID=D4H2U9_DENA2|nr:hypothetical protein [Denitrovibrio acetiphilus]ADD68972.1 hypothetical protein Dacet_2210 [Denitrovibrio acetiphilus DSM 12809]
MSVFSWLAGKINSGCDLSVFDMKDLSRETLAKECHRFMEKGSFVRLSADGIAAGVVITNEAHTGNDKGGAEVSAS